ncbi:MAG TPA: serine hydrolase domain-containing protein [Rhizomicrobium sp.]|nr:serine hydrolase domain-containing protein [Rhizomicrobium sp.]
MLLALACLLGAADAAPKTNTEILNAWLTAYNKGDPASLTAFQKDYLGKSNIRFEQDSREETGGFILDRIEVDEPSQLTALIRERDRPQFWHVTLQRNSSEDPILRNVNYLPVAVSQGEALAALSAFGDKMAAADKFSGVVTITRGGKTIFAKAWGLADRAAHKPITLDTPFYFASQGKMFTAVSVLQLIEMGKLSLDDPIGKYLTDYPNAEMAKVTVRQLLTHQGGTGEMGILEPQDVQNRDKVRSIDDIIALNGSRGPAFPPGSKYEYSNYGFLLLGALVDKISGQSYYDYVEDHVFRPSGMTHTRFPLREDTSMAITYTNLSGGPVRSAMDQLPWRGTPAGGGISTASDMQRFVMALKAEKLLSPAMLAEATKKQVKEQYGYGFISSGFYGFPYWGHGGGAEGMSSVLSYYPVTDTIFVCESNRDPPICDRLAFNYLFRSPKTP